MAIGTFDCAVPEILMIGVSAGWFCADSEAQAAARTNARKKMARRRASSSRSSNSRKGTLASGVVFGVQLELDLHRQPVHLERQREGGERLGVVHRLDHRAVEGGEAARGGELQLQETPG